MKNNGEKRIPYSSFIFIGLAWLLVACIVAQTLFAGIGLFTDASFWNVHIVFVRIFEFVPILMLIFAFTGKLPVALRWRSLALFLLIYFQYFTANLQPIKALHPVAALVLFWLSFSVATRSNLILKKENKNHEEIGA